MTALLKRLAPIADPQPGMIDHIRKAHPEIPEGFLELYLELWNVEEVSERLVPVFLKHFSEEEFDKMEGQLKLCALGDEASFEVLAKIGKENKGKKFQAFMSDIKAESASYGEEVGVLAQHLLSGRAINQ